MVEPLSGRKIEVALDASALMRAAADEVARRAEEAVASRGRFLAALAGGATPRRLYALLADPRERWRARVDWGRTHVFFGDERHVHPDDPESNYGMARARAADEKLTAVAGALNRALPALQRLSTLPDAVNLQGDARQRVTVELSAFFTAFSEILVQATEALQDGGRDGPKGGPRRTGPR